MNRAEETRKRLQEEAIRLFSQRGFDAVTVEEVARAAGVSHMTFFRHFPTKEAAVLHDPYDPLLGAAVSAQDASLAPLERVRRALLDAWGSVEEPDDEMTRKRVELAASHPALRAKVWENNKRSEDVIVSALVEDGTPILDARVAAGAILGGLTAALFDWAEQSQDVPLGDRVEHALSMLAPEPSR